MESIKCKICSGSTGKIRDRQFETDYFYCGGCGFLSIEDKKIPGPEAEKERYLQHINTPEDQGYMDWLRDFTGRAVTPFFPGFKTALDFGCGPGPVLAGILKETGAEVDTYDIYFAPEKVYENKTYDVITCTEVLEHIEDPLPVLELLKSHLNTGGVLAIMTMFHPIGPPGGEEAFNKWWYRRDPTHISFFRPKTFQYIANRLNLRILTIDNKNIISLR